VRFWLDFILSFPRSIKKTMQELRQRRLLWLAPLVIFLLLTAVFLLVVGSVQPLAPFIYSLI
jgi:hypothetical protein